MTTHPPGHPTGPTGPGRTDTPGPADAAFRPSDGPGTNPIGDWPDVDQLIDKANADILAALDEMVDTEAGPRRAKGLPPEPLPRLGEVIRDLERLLRQGLTILERRIDPESYPAAPMAHAADAGFEIVGFQLEAVLRELAKIAELSPPPVGSAVEVSFVGPSAMDPAAFAKQVAAAMRRNAEGRPS